MGVWGLVKGRYNQQVLWEHESPFRVSSVVTTLNQNRLFRFSEFP